MISRLRAHIPRRALLIAPLLAFCLASIFPATASAHAIADSHMLSSSFIFTVPTLSLNGNTILGQSILGAGNVTGQLDAPTTFNFVMITLVELGSVFWVGAQLWLMFVLQLAPTDDDELNTINQQIQQRFERRWSLPVLLVLLLANIGVLVGQALNITPGQWGGSLCTTSACWIDLQRAFRHILVGA